MYGRMVGTPLGRSECSTSQPCEQAQRRRPAATAAVMAAAEMLADQRKVQTETAERSRRGVFAKESSSKSSDGILEPC